MLNQSKQTIDKRFRIICRSSLSLDYLRNTAVGAGAASVEEEESSEGASPCPWSFYIVKYIQLSALEKIVRIWPLNQ